MRLVMNCPASRQDIGPFEDLSVLTKFALVQQVVRTCFCDCLTSSRSQKTYSHLFSVTSETQVMKSTNCYKICPLVRIGPNCLFNFDYFCAFFHAIKHLEKLSQWSFEHSSVLLCNHTFKKLLILNIHIGSYRANSH